MPSREARMANRPKTNAAIDILLEAIIEESDDGVIAVSVLFSEARTIFKELRQPDVGYRAVSNIKGQPINLN